MVHDVFNARRGTTLDRDPRPITGAGAAGPGKQTLVEQAYPSSGQPRAGGEASPGTAMPSIQEAPPSATGREPGTGSPLPRDVRTSMERVFGANFADVRVHQGPEAQRAGAQAYAQGADLHFAPGRFDPHGEAGLGLLGHELAHVVQHAEGRAPGAHGKRSDGGGEPGLEREADELGARAARGELARPGAPEVVARRDPGGAIQRMIDSAAPPGGSDWDRILRYLDKTLINQRKQTFRQAVEEYLACGLAPDARVANAWNELEAHHNAVDWEATALARITTIRDAINSDKSDAPDHPNKRGIGPDEERYETVPQSARSQQIAENLRARLLSDMFDRKYNHGKHAFFDGTKLVPLGSGDKWSSSFMLAVLILPNGLVNVAHSGHLCPVQSTAFQTIVARVDRRYQVTTHDDDSDYTALKQLYRTSLDRDARTGKLPANHTAGPDRDDRHKHKVIEKSGPSVIEKGNPTGVCAAPQVLAPANALATPFPAMLQGSVQMALTEVLVRSSDSAVEVNDASGSPQSYDHDAPDVPSCLTCQHQLREVLTKLVELRRNIVNLDGVRWDEGERARLYVAASELRALIADGGKIATIVLGKKTVTEDYQVDVDKQVQRFKKPPPNKPVEMKTIKVTETRQRQVAKPREPAVSKDHLVADVAQLEKLIEGYRKAVHKQATERTAHPEFIEHDNHTTQPSLATLSQAETDARAEHDTNHMEALLTRRIAVGKLIGGNDYNQERQVASDRAKVPGRAKAATDKRQAEAEDDALASNTAERELRDHAQDDARASAARRIRATQTEAAREDRSEDALRTQASRDARTSSARHHHDDNVRFAADEQEQSDRLLALATQLAQAFDTTIGHQLHLLITGESSDPTSQTDFSDAYIG